MIVLVVVVVAIGSRVVGRWRNDWAVERLRQQLIGAEFDKIYDESSALTQKQNPRNDFKVKLENVAIRLKEIDPEIRWTRSSVLVDRSVFRDDNYSGLDLETNGRKINIQLDWQGSFQLCGLSLINGPNDIGERVFRNCD